MLFQILCVTMHQKDFSKISEMNIRSDIIFANQADENSVKEISYDGCHMAKMITTDTIGVGTNRNIALLHATADICLLADDDICYSDDVESIVLGEFEKYPSADLIVFYLENDNKDRALEKYDKPRVYKRYMRKPWGAVRIAFRLNSIKKNNIWFTTLFGGGALFSSGEDSMWIQDAIKKGLKIVISEKCIGKICDGESTWYSGKNESYYYGKGAFYQACYPKMKFFWMLYFAIRTHGMTSLRFTHRIRWMCKGMDGYDRLLSYQDYIAKDGEM